MNWSDQNEADAVYGALVFDWLVRNGMCDAAALVFADCIMFVKHEEWTFELAGPEMEMVCRLFAGNKPERLLPVLKKLDEDDYSEADFKQALQLALSRWAKSSCLQLDATAPQSPLPSSGEWLELIGI